MAIFLDQVLFFDFAELNLAPTPALAEADLSSCFNLSNHPSINQPTHPTGKVTEKVDRAKEAVYIKKVQ